MGKRGPIACPELFYRDMLFCDKRSDVAIKVGGRGRPPSLDSQLCFSLYATTIAINRTDKSPRDGLVRKVDG
jgi:hypothetical protein